MVVKDKIKMNELVYFTPIQTIVEYMKNKFNSLTYRLFLF